MGVDLSFFQIAAALIPVLLLGSVISERFQNFRPEHLRSPLRPAVPVLVIALFGGFPAAAEVLDAALSDEPTRFQAWVVALAVVFGTCALAASVVAPWVRHLWTTGGFVGKAVLLASFGAAVFAGGNLLFISIEYEYVREQADRTRPSESVDDRALLDAYDALDQYLTAPESCGRHHQAACFRTSAAYSGGASRGRS